MLQSRDTLSRLCAGVLGAKALVASCPLTAAGEDSLRDSAANIDQVLPETELDEATEESEAAPREGGLFKRLGPQQVTPEEQAQAEHLRKLAAKYGTDPTAIVGRIQSSSAYYDLHQGGHAVDTTARIDLPLQRNFLLRVDAPFLKWSEPNRPGTSVSRGLSDMAVTAAWRVYNTPEYAVALGVISTCPTAAETALGLGKYTVGPPIATVRFVPRWESFLIGLFTQQISVGGDASRNSVNRSKFQAQVNSFWADRWWSIVQAVFQADWDRCAKTSLTLEFEVGRSLVGRWGVFVRPGVGIFGRDLIGAYDWNVEGGVRYMFRSF